MPWTRAELAYLAGFIDGEGSISIFASSSVSKGRRYQRLRLILSAYNTDPEVLMWVADRFAGTFRQVKRAREYWKPSYCWSTGWQNAARVLEAILPYLKVKRRQAEIFIAVAATSKRRGAYGTPPEVLAFRSQAAASMAELNRRGSNAMAT